MNTRFRLEQSTEQPGWWVLTDTENLVVIRFQEHQFNDTQKVTVLDESALLQHSDCANKLAHIMSQMAHYMFSHWYSIAMPTPVFEFRMDDENSRLFLIRNKFPKFSLEVEDICHAKQLADSLKAAGEFVKKSKLR